MLSCGRSEPSLRNASECTSSAEEKTRAANVAQAQRKQAEENTGRRKPAGNRVFRVTERHGSGKPLREKRNLIFHLISDSR